MEQWKTNTLQNLCAIGDGNHSSKYPKKSEMVESGVPFIRGNNLKDGELCSKDILYISPEKHKELKKGHLRTGDVLFTNRGEIGKVAIVTEYFNGANLNSQIAWLRCGNQLLPKYLLYYLQTKAMTDLYDSEKSGAALQQFTIKMLRIVEVHYPPLSEQQHIVAILDQAFVDIEKARANAEKNLKNARELFDSYLNQVSADKKPLGSYVTIKTGKLNSNAATEDGAYPFFTCSRDVFSIDSYSFDCEAILLAGNNASGDFNVKHFCGKFDAYQRTYVITINEVDQLLYSYLYYQMTKSLRQLKNSSVGAGTKFLKIGMIQNLEISIPSISEQQRILDVLEPLKKSIEQLEKTYKTKIASLDELKKSLLQKAFSGELTKTQGHAA